jgi:hypothetical protein
MRSIQISDEEIAEAFNGYSFGTAEHRQLLAASVFKKMVGYHCGSSATTIMTKMGLIGRTGKPTKRGRGFVASSYSNLMKASG